MESKKFTVSHCIGRCVVLLGVSYRLIAATSPSSSVTWKVHSLRQLRCQLFCFRAFRQLPIRSDCPNASRAPPSLGHLNLLALHSFFAEIAGTRQVSILPHFGMAGDEPVAVRHENNKTQTHCSFAKCFANGIRAFLQSKQQHENPPRERVLPTTTSEPKAQVPSLLRMHASSLGSVSQNQLLFFCGDFLVLQEFGIRQWRVLTQQNFIVNCLTAWMTENYQNPLPLREPSKENRRNDMRAPRRTPPFSTCTYLQGWRECNKCHIGPARNNND